MNKNAVEYAIVDIETTGGNASHSRITEIAIYIHNGTEVIERWETLIHPQKEIPPAIWALTGINNEMVADAPIFDDVAEKVYSYLKNRIFVAHNVNFDYSFIKHELELAGIQWSAKKLCTVRLSRKLIPGLVSYSLGRLCDAINIPITNRHRAGGDTEATSILFTKLLENEKAQEVITQMLKRSSTDQRLPPHLPPEQFEDLPHQIGVYYFHNQKGDIIYVGKAINIKKRVATHFTGHNIYSQRQNFLKEIYSISYELCGTELMSLLLECSEIKKFWPKYNRALKKFEPQFGIFTYEAINGYTYLITGKISKHHQPIMAFHTQFEAINVLKTIAREYNIDYRFCKFTNTTQTSQLENEESLPDKKTHNAQINDAIENYISNRPSYIIIDKGRTKDEKSCIYVSNGQLKAIGYIDHHTQVDDIEDIINHLKPCISNFYMTQLVHQYSTNYPHKIKILQEDYVVKNQISPTTTTNYKKHQQLLF